MKGKIVEYNETLYSTEEKVEVETKEYKQQKLKMIHKFIDDLL